MNEADVISFLGPALAALGLAGLAFFAARVRLPNIPSRGARGQARQRIRGEIAFRAVEPVVRFLAGHIGRLPLRERRTRIDRAIVRAGDFLGLLPDELIAVSVLASVAGLGVGVGFVAMFESPTWIAVGVALGGALPWMQLRSAAKQREKQITRALPGAIDLAAMCMGAGLDFPGAIRQVVSNTHHRSPIRVELERILSELSLGRTRKQALQSLRDRVPTDAVREFVSAVTQAEEKGNPLAEVLGIQAGVLRMRRSVMAEEAAARAGVFMMLPLMMMFGCVFLLILGPLVVQFANGGM